MYSITASAALIAQLKRHEGFSPIPYLCPAGVCTIGYGTNLEAHPEYIPPGRMRAAAITLSLRGRELCAELRGTGMRWGEDRAEGALRDEVNVCMTQLEQRCPIYARLRQCSEDVRADVLVNMAFNLGVSGLLKFVNTLRLIDEALSGKCGFDKAAEGMLHSRWASQVGRRALELARQMETGRYADGANI